MKFKKSKTERNNLFLYLIILTLVCFFGTCKTNELNDSVTGCPLSGMVFYSSTPLNGVKIDLKRETDDYLDEPLQSTTSDNGFYCFRNIEPGKYWLKVYGPTDEFWRWWSHQTKVSEFRETTFNIYLVKIIEAISPAFNAIVNSSTPTLSWEVNQETMIYKVFLRNIDIPGFIERGESTIASYKVKTRLQTGITYQWDVNAYDANNIQVGSLPSSFFTVSK